MRLSIFALLLMLAPSYGGTELTSLRDRLYSPDLPTAKQALEEIDQASPYDRKQLVSALIPALRRNGDAAGIAAIALARCGKDGEAAVGELVEALRYDDPGVAVRVGEALVKIGPASVKPLIKALDDPNFLVRERAAGVLGAFGPEARRAAPDLVALLQDGQHGVQTAAEAALIKIGPPAVPALENGLKKMPPLGRQTLVRALAGFGLLGMPSLIQTLRKDASASVRVSAASALGVLRPSSENAISALTGALKDFDDNVRTATVEALTQLGLEARAAIGSLILAVHRDSSALVRQRSATALKQIGRGSKDSLPALIENLKAPESEIRRESVIALGIADISADQTMAWAALALKDADPTVRVETLHAVGATAKGNPKAADLLQTAVADPQKEIRFAAIEALGEISPATQATVDILEEALKDAELSMRNAAIQSLAKLGAIAVPALLRETKDSYTILADNAEQAIVQMGAPAVPALEKAESDSDLVLKKKAAALLRKIHNAAPPKQIKTKKKKTPRS